MSILSKIYDSRRKFQWGVRRVSDTGKPKRFLGNAGEPPCINNPADGRNLYLAQVEMGTHIRLICYVYGDTEDDAWNEVIEYAYPLRGTNEIPPHLFSTTAELERFLRKHETEGRESRYWRRGMSLEEFAEANNREPTYIDGVWIDSRMYFEKV